MRLTSERQGALLAPGFTEFGANGLRQYSGYVREEWLPQLIGRKGSETQLLQLAVQLLGE